jgi:hypothetical protein
MTIYTITLDTPVEGGLSLQQPAFTAIATPFTDDGNVIERIELQYGTDPTFVSMTQINQIWVPSGVPQLFPISGLLAGTNYYFRARSGDGSAVWSAWSGTGQVLTLPAATPTPAAVYPAWSTGLAAPSSTPTNGSTYAAWSAYIGFSGPPASVR